MALFDTVVVYTSSRLYQMMRLKAMFSSERGSYFRQNFVRIAKANIFSQILLLAFMPLLTRLYGPEAFGIAALFTTALQITGSVCTWRFDRILPNTSNRQAAAAVWAIGLGILLFFVFVCAVVLMLSPSALNTWQGYAILGSLMLYLPIALSGTGIQQLFRGWYARESNLASISKARITQTCSYLFIAICIGAIGTEQNGLIIAASLSVCIPVATLWKYSDSLSSKLQHLNVKKIQVVAKQHIGQASLAAVVALVNVTSLTAPVILLSQLYSAAELGWYALMYRVVTTPLGTIMNALSISFWSRSAELIRHKKSTQALQLYLSITKKMLVPAILVVLFAIVAPYLIPVLFSAEWDGAGRVLQATTPMLIGYTLFSATNHLIVLRRQGLQLIADGLRLCLMLLSILSAHELNWDFETAVLALSISSFFGHLCLFGIHIAVHKRL